MLRKRILHYSVVALIVGVVGHGMASAQGAPEGEPVPPPADTDPAKQADLSIAEQLEQSKKYIARMESVRASIRRDLEQARQQRDVVKTLCLNDKLNQIDVALRSANERMRALDLAAKRGDKDLTNHEFTILSVLHQRSDQIDSEAKQCIGKEIGIIGESSVVGTIDPGMPDGDLTDVPDFEVVTPPMCASCIL